MKKDLFLTSMVVMGLIIGIVGTASAANYAAGSTQTGICTVEHTGQTSGTSTGITALWCQNATTVTNGTCTLNNNTLGTCTYTTTCNTNYHITGTSDASAEVDVPLNKTTTSTTQQCKTCDPDIYTITLNSNGGGTNSAVYEKYGDGYYSTAAATGTAITSVTPPTRGGYTFRGYYTTQVTDVTSNNSSGTQDIKKVGTLPGNTKYTQNTTLYAGWAQNCATVTNGNCSLAVTDAGAVTYTTSCNTGYDISGSGTSAPTCTAHKYTVTYASGNGGSGSIASTTATYNVNFTPATPSGSTITKANATFAGWTVSGTSDTKDATFKWEYTENKTLTATWKCNAGYTLNSSTNACDKCAAGTYKSTVGNEACTAASSGYYVPGQGATEQIACVKGSYSTKASASTTCTACPAGRTTAGAGTAYNATPNTACSATCPAITNLNTWNTQTWNSSNNTVTNLCTVATCKACSTGTGASTCSYSISNNACAYTGVCLAGYSTPAANGTTVTCTANNIILNWNENGADSTIGNGSCNYGGSINFPASSTIMRNGYSFNGWATAK